VLLPITASFAVVLSQVCLNRSRLASRFARLVSTAMSLD
jgi:hypothetical protein